MHRPDAPRSADLQCFMYHSQLASEALQSQVPAIVKTARRFNPQANITGMLVFDGAHFCQYLEGPSPALQILIARIAQDARHTAFTPQHYGPLEGERRFAHWALGYADLDAPLSLQQLQAFQGDAALTQFVALLPSLDMA